MAGVLDRDAFAETLASLAGEGGGSDYDNIYYLENAVDDVRDALGLLDGYDVVREPFFDGSTREGLLVWSLRKYNGESYELILDYSYRRGAGMIVWSVELKKVA